MTQMIHHGRGLVAAQEVVADDDLQKVFEADMDGQDAQPADSGAGIKARPRTKEEEWWPF